MSYNSTYNEMMRDIDDLSGAVFLKTRMDFAKYMRGDGDCTMVVGYLMNRLRMKNSSTRDRASLVANKLFMECPYADFKEDMGMEEGKVRRVLRKLEKWGFLEITHRKGNITWIKLNTKNLLAAAEEMRQRINFHRSVKTTDQNCQNDSSHENCQNDSSLYIEEKEREECPPTRDARGDTPFFQPLIRGNNTPSKQIDIIFFDMEKQLRSTLRSKNPPIVVGKGRRDKWAEEFRKLHKALGKDTARIQRVLDWYERRVNTVQKPKITDAAGFCNPKVFNWLEDLMEQDPDVHTTNPLLFETIIKDGKKIKRPLEPHEEPPICIKIPLGKNRFTKILVREYLEQGKPLPEWHWEGRGMDQHALANEVMKR